MTTEEILEALCYHDIRNPHCTDGEEEIKERNERNLKKGKSCSCDNCFYNRTELANELLKYINKP